MQFCTRCGRPRNEAARFCTACGTPFPAPPATAAGDAPTPPAGAWLSGGGDAARYGIDDILDSGRPGRPDTAPRRDRRSHRLALVALVVIVLVGGGTTAALLLSGGHRAPRTGQADGGSSTAQASARRTPRSASPVPPTASTPGSGQVGVAAALASNPRTPQIVALLDSYFSAINGRDYQHYIALLTPQEQQTVTPAQFSTGFGSTKDSGELLQGISVAAGGTTVAAVTFTSHQNPAESINGSESCTRWHILLYLQPNGNGYLIGKPPASYKASYAAC